MRVVVKEAQDTSAECTDNSFILRDSFYSYPQRGVEEIEFKYSASEEELAHAFRILKPNGMITIPSTSSNSSAAIDMTLAGFVSVEGRGELITGRKPVWALGESAPIQLKQSPTSVKWTLSSLDDGAEEDDLVDEDELLRESIVAAPTKADGGTVPCGEAVGVPGKKRACKDCSCGLAEEEASASMAAVKILTLEEKVAKAGSCGGCYKGDAFRCGGCPFLGKPAFEPGNERVVLALGPSDF